MKTTSHYIFVTALSLCSSLLYAQNIDWQEYPQAQELLIQPVQAQLRPQQSLHFVASEDGQLQLQNADLPRISQQKAGTLWARINPQSLDFEQKKLELRRQALAIQEDYYHSVTLPNKRIALWKEKAEAETLHQLSRKLQDQPQLLRALQELYPDTDWENPNFTAPITERYQALTQEARFQKADHNPDLLELALQKIEWQEAQLTLEQAMQDSKLTIPFDCTLTLHLPRSEQQQSLRIRSGELLATAENLDQLLLSLSSDNITWTQLPTQQLSIQWTMRSRQKVSAPFSLKRLQLTNTGESTQYLFRIPDDISPQLQDAVGNTLQAKLILQLEKPARIVPKVDLAQASPSASQSWVELLANIDPQATLLAEGQSHLAILP